MNRRSTNLALAGSLAAAVLTLSASAMADEPKLEKCYGVSLKGHNDCKSAVPGSSCAGTSKVDYDGQSFKDVPAGTCVTMKTPYGNGSLTPVKRPV